MNKKLPETNDNNDDLAEHVGGAMSCPPTEFERCCEREPVRRSTGVVVRGGRRLFDWRVAREQMIADFARWKRSSQPRAVAVARQPVGRFFGRRRRRTKRQAARPAANADPDNEDSSTPSDAIGAAP